MQDYSIENFIALVELYMQRISHLDQMLTEMCAEEDSPIPFKKVGKLHFDFLYAVNGLNTAKADLEYWKIVKDEKEYKRGNQCDSNA